MNITSTLPTPTQGSGAGPDLPPAAALGKKYGPALVQTGATSVQATGMDQLKVTFGDAWDGRFASETLKNVIDGVKISYEGPADQYTPDILSSARDQAKFAARLPGVTGFSTEGNDVTFRVANDAEASFVSSLLRDEFEGTGMTTKVIAGSII